MCSDNIVSNNDNIIRLAMRRPALGLTLVSPVQSQTSAFGYIRYR